MDVLEAMETCRAIRYLKPDPVPDELVEKLIWAATRAPSPGNSQGWHFIVVTDEAKRRTIGDAIAAVMVPRFDTLRDPDADRSQQLIMRGAHHLASSIGDAPVLIFVGGPPVYPAEKPRESFIWSACYPAAGWLVLAARALGLGATFTTFHGVAEPTIREVLSIPDEVRLAAMIPVGFPDASYGPVNRRPVAEVIHRDGW